MVLICVCVCVCVRACVRACERASERACVRACLRANGLRTVNDPTFMFDEHGNMKDAETKSNLKNALKVKVSRRLAGQDVQSTFHDGCAVLWIVPWLTSSTVFDYVAHFHDYLYTLVVKGDVYLEFDRYSEGHITEATRHGMVYTLH